MFSSYGQRLKTRLFMFALDRNARSGSEVQLDRSKDRQLLATGEDYFTRRRMSGHGSGLSCGRRPGCLHLIRLMHVAAERSARHVQLTGPEPAARSPGGTWEQATRAPATVVFRSGSASSRHSTENAA